MTSVAQILVVMGLLFVATLAVKKQDFSKNYSEPYYSLYHRLAKNFNQSLAYVMCNATVSWYDLNCSFKLKMLNGIEKHCDVSFAHLQNFGDLYSTMANKALFELSLVNDSAEYKRIALIDMNNCNSVHLDFPDDDYYHLLVYDNSFHVTTKNNEKCGEEHNPCTIRYNNDGEQIGEPVPFPPKYYRQGYAMVVDRHNSSSGGFFTTYEKIKGHEYQMNVSHVSNDGTEMVLLKNYVMRKNVEGAQVQSSGYGYFSFCHRQFELRGVITCKQYDTMGQMIMNSKFKLPWGHKILKVFNLRNGGMILIYFRCSYSNCLNTDVNIRVMPKWTAPWYFRYIASDVGLYSYYGKEGEEFSIDHTEIGTENCFYFANGPHRWYEKDTIFRYVEKCINISKL